MQIDKQLESLLSQLQPKSELEMVAKIKSKLNNKKKVVMDFTKELSTEKLLKFPMQERLAYINRKAKRILRRYVDKVEVGWGKESLHKYVDDAIKNGIIALDTETNDTTDYLNCKLVGLCLYTKGRKAAYFPVNHTNWENDERIPNQCTEEDVREEVQRLIDAGVKFVLQNGKFDRQVLQCTCDVIIPIHWDTMIAARLLDENIISAGLKALIRQYIEQTQDPYSIESLFGAVKNEYLDPYVFALYAAVDALDTLLLKDFQEKWFNEKGLERLYHSLYLETELPVTPITADIELRGIAYDKPYSDRLAKKYHKLLEDYNIKLQEELDKLQPKVDAWRKSDIANYKPKTTKGKKQSTAKSLAEKLDNPLTPDSLGSSTQLAILLYDILGMDAVDEDNPRSTDKETLPILAKKYNSELLKVLSERNKVNTLVRDFIDKLPTLLNPKDGKIHCHFNQIGSEEKGIVTGRFSSTDPNLQQIPSHNKEIRLLFKGSEYEYHNEVNDNLLEIEEVNELETTNGWKFCKDINVGDYIITEEDTKALVSSISKVGTKYIFKLEEK